MSDGLVLTHPRYGAVRLPRRDIEHPAYARLLTRWVDHILTKQLAPCWLRILDEWTLVGDVWVLLEDEARWDLHLHVLLGLNRIGTVRTFDVIGRYASDLIASHHTHRHSGEMVQNLVEWTTARLDDPDWVRAAMHRAGSGELDFGWR